MTKDVDLKREWFSIYTCSPVPSKSMATFDVRRFSGEDLPPSPGVWILKGRRRSVEVEKLVWRGGEYRLLFPGGDEAWMMRKINMSTPSLIYITRFDTSPSHVDGLAARLLILT